MRFLSRKSWLALLPALPMIAMGCAPSSPGDNDQDNDQQVISQAVNLLNSNINSLQTLDPRALSGLPPGVAADFYGDFLDDPAAQFTELELENSVILGFENMTPNDVYVTYRVDGVTQSVYVIQDQTVVIGYGCLSIVELVSQTQYDIGTGAAAGTFDFVLGPLVKPADFTCGQILILSIGDLGIASLANVIDFSALP